MLSYILLNNTINVMLLIGAIYYLYSLRYTEDKLKESFNIAFYKLIDMQYRTLDTFEISILDEWGESVRLKGEDAIRLLELHIENLTPKQTVSYIETIDEYDSIFSSVRNFYNAVKLINTTFTNSKDRINQIKLLISLTNFSQFRVIVLGIHFLDTQAAKYLSQDTTVIEVLNELGIESIVKEI